MSKFRIILGVILFGAFVPAAFCASSLQDAEFNVNGTLYANPNAVPGLSLATFDTTTGQGTLTLTYDPGKAGTFNFDAWIFDAVATPFYNEYGAKSGSPAAGQSWQVDVPDYDSDSNHTGTILHNTENDSLDNKNHLPGTADNYLNNCATGSTCNDAASMAMGFKFTLTATQEEVVTLLLSPNNPGGFYLEQIHPVDGNNSSTTDLFFSGSAMTQASCTGPKCGPPPPPASPEPATWSLLAAGSAVVIFSRRRRFFRA